MRGPFCFAIVAAGDVMLFVVLAKPGPLARLAWPWYVAVGLAVTLLVGSFP